jgi:hypothetical protein
MAIATSNDVDDFHEQLKAILPRLRIYALSLTRDRDAADDLVHDTVISQAPTSRPGCSAFSATNSSPACVASGRAFRSIRRLPNRCRIRHIRTVA